MSQNLKHKILTQEETPKYSFRKYSFGLASALIGLTAFSGGLKGTIAKADTVSNSAVADQEDIDAKQNNKQATLDISYSDEQKQAQDSNKSVAENKNDNQVNTDQKQVANVQAKNDSQVSHNENNESKEPAVTVKKQATAQQTNSNTVKEEQESKQVVTKSQENTNTSTATKQVKNNETSATIANAMVNNGENRSAVAPKADENKNTTTLDVNKLSAESNNTKGNFLSLLNNFAVVKSASTKAPYDIDANWDYTITATTNNGKESDVANITGYKGTSNDVFIPNAADFKADGKNNVDAVHINPSLMRKLATRQGTTSITVSNTDGQFVDAVDDSNFTMDNSGNLPVYSVNSNGNPANVNWNNTDLTTGGNKTTGTDLFGHHDGWKYVFQNGHQGWYYVNNGVIYNDDKLPSKTENIVTGSTSHQEFSTQSYPLNQLLPHYKSNGDYYGSYYLVNPKLPSGVTLTINSDGEGEGETQHSGKYTNSYTLVDGAGVSHSITATYTPGEQSGYYNDAPVCYGVTFDGHWYQNDESTDLVTLNTGSRTVYLPVKSNTQLIDYNDVKNITRSPANVASTLKSVDTEGLHGADIDPLANNTIAREYKIIENLPDGTQKVLFDWNGQINQDPDGTYNQYPAQVTVTGANGQYTQPKNSTNGNIDNGWWHITPDIKSGYTISVTPEYSTDDATKMGLELMPQYDSNNNLTHITFDLAPSKSMLQSQTFYVNYTAQTKQMKVGEDGITDHDLHRTITRTITITDPQGKTTNQTQTVSFNRTGTINTATGEKHFNAWQNDKDGKDTYTFDKVDVPTVPGYTASQNEVPATTVTSDTTDQTIDISYTANSQTIHINYVDSAGKIVHTTTITGKTGETVSLNLTVPDKYQLADGQQLPTTYTFAAYNGDVTIHLTHKVVQREATVDVQIGFETLVDLNDEIDPATVVTQTHWTQLDDEIKDSKDFNSDKVFPSVKVGTLTGHVNYDLVDNKVVSFTDDWTSLNVGGQTYQMPDGTEVVNGVLTDSEDAWGKSLKEQFLKYYPDADPDYVNRAWHGYLSANKTNEIVASDFLRDYLQAGLAGNESNALAKAIGDRAVTAVKTVNKTIDSNWLNGNVDTSEFSERDGQLRTDALVALVGVYVPYVEKTATRTINVTTPDGKTATVKQTATLAKRVDFGKDAHPDWTTNEWTSYDVPVIPGYTASQSNVAKEAVTGTTKDQTVNITYTANPQTTTVVYQAEDGTPVHITTVKGQTGQTVKVTNEVPAGWMITKGQVPSEITFGPNGTPQTVVTIAHQHVTVDPDHPQNNGTKLPDNSAKTFSGVEVNDLNKTITRTINVTTPDGKTNTTKQTAKLTRTAEVDEVTGEVTYGNWTTGKWSNYDVPTVPGYTASQKEVPATEVTSDTTDQTINVSYTANSQTIHINYVDSTGKTVRTTAVTGKTGETVNLNLTVPDKYQLADGQQLPTTFTFAAYNGDVTIVLKHKVVQREAAVDVQIGLMTLVDLDDEDDPAIVVTQNQWRQLDDEIKKHALVNDLEKVDPTVGVVGTLTGHVNYDLVDKKVVSFEDDWTSLNLGGKTYQMPDGTEVVNGIIVGTELSWGEKLKEHILKYVPDIDPDYVTRPWHGYLSVNKSYMGSDFLVGNEPNALAKSTGDRAATAIEMPNQPIDLSSLQESSMFGYLSDFNEQDGQLRAKAIVTVDGMMYIPYVEKTATRTINVTTPDGKTTSVKQTATLAKQVTAQEDAHPDWTTSEWTSYDVPVIPGYTASQSNVAKEAVTGTTKDQTVNITYTANDGTQTIIYQGEDDSEIGKQVIHGKTDETVKVTPDVPDGYVLKGEVPSEVTIKPDDTPITVTVEHGKSHVTPDKPVNKGDLIPDTKDKHYPEGLTHNDLNKTVTREITIIDPTGKKSTTTQTVTFTRGATVDEVTNKVTYDDWSENGKHTFDKVDVPTVQGYTASGDVPSLTVTPDSQDQNITINYVANGQTSSYYFVDDDGNGQKVGEDHQISGKTDQTINFTVAAPANYELVNAQDANQSYTFKADGNTPVVIHLKHHRASATGAKNKDVDDHRTITREIDIVSPDGKQTVERQTVEFTRPATEDMVTGQITYGDWSDGGQKQMPALTLPDQSGYHADITVPAITVTPDSKPEPVKVTYVASDQAVKLSFVDRSGAVVGTKTINGKTDQTYNVSLSDLPAHYEIDGSLPVYKFTDQADQALTVHVKQNKDDYTAIAQPITVKHGETPNASDGIKNTQDMPSGTSYAWGTEPQLPQGKTYGDTTGTVVVTFPDGSNESVTVPVHFNSEAEDNAKKGDQAVAFNGTKIYYHGQAVADLTLNDLTNADNVKSVVWANKPDTSKIGNGNDTATVTFNDGTTTVINGNYTVTPNDSDKIGTIETQPITVKHGQDPASVDPKDGIKTALPDGTKVNWTTKPALPSGQTYGDTKGTAEVDFPDGSKQSVEITVHVNSDAEDNAKKGDQAVAFNGTKTYYHGQAVADLTLNDLTNADNVKSVVWANKPDTSKIGNGADSATVTFNDGTTTVINGNYTVTPNDSDKIGTIETQPITVKHGQDPASVDPKDGIKTTLPDGSKVNWTTKPALPSGQTYGDTKGTAEVDFPDGSKQSVEITVHVNSDAEDNAKKGDQAVAFNGTKTYYHGQAVADLTLNDLTNADNVKSVVWTTKPDTSKIGSGADSATLTFNDGTTTVINGNYTVTPNDSDKIGTIETQPITVKHGQDPASVDPKDGIKTTLPDGTQVNWTTKPQLPSGQTYGDTKGTAEVDFPDGSKQSVEIPVHVNSDAEDNKSKGDQGVSLKVTDKVYYHGENVPDLTLNDLINADNVKSVVWANKPDTSKIGAGSDSATVTFNDGTTATVGGSYVVNPNDSDKTGTIETQPITVKHGQDPASIDPKEGIKTKLPDGTQVNWTTKPALPSGQTYGDTKGTAEVDFPDGSKQSVEIPVHFNSQAEDNAKKGDQGVGFKNPSQVYSHNQTVPDLTLNDLNNPDNVKSVVWANKPDTSKTGAGTDSATVTFNDGSTVTIKGSYVVNSIDATDLSKAIKDGQDAQKTTKYTNGSDKAKKDLDDALNKGIKDINNPDLSQDQADKDAKDIEDAIKNLDGKATDTTSLDKAIQDGKDTQKTVHYDNSSDKAKKDLDDAINKAVKDKKNPNLSQDQADKDAKDIEDAIKNLDGKATDTSNLNKAIKDGQNAQKSDKYKNSTSKAQKALDDAINKAINDLKNPKLTQKQADQDARAIEDAIKGLDGKANNNKQSQGTKTNTETDGNGVVQASTIGDKTNSNELPQTGENNNTIALASGIATALTAGIGMLAEGKKRKRE